MSELRFKKYLRLISKKVITKETTLFAWLEASLKNVNAIYWIIFLGIVVFFILMVIVFEENSKQYYLSKKTDGFWHKSNQLNTGDCQLNKKKLSHCNFSYHDLRKADLTNANLTGANLNFADLSGADLSDAKLMGATLVDANLSQYVPSSKSPQKNSITKLKNADLTGANLNFADLSGADLSDAKLMGATLVNANLSYAKLERVDLTRIIISKRFLKVREPRDSPFRDYFRREIAVFQHNLILEGADLTKSNLSRLDLSGLNLKGAILQGANLSYANLTRAVLTKTNLIGANIEGANLFSADITNSEFLPLCLNVQQFHGLKGISEINTENIGIDKLEEWKKQANSPGMHNIERGLISGITKYHLRQEPIDSDWIFQVVVLGGYFTDYGANPLGIFRYFIYSLGIFTIIYYILMHPDTPKYGVLKITKNGDIEKALVLERNWIDAFWFSLLSATHIGYGDIQPGSLLPRLQLEEYTLKGKGIVRRFAGFQSLIGVYIILVLITTYFNNPFA